MTIKYKEIRAQGEFADMAREIGLEKLNDWIKGESNENCFAIVNMNEEIIPGKYKDRPTVIYLHIYYTSEPRNAYTLI